MTEGGVGRLDGLLLHYTYETMEQYIDKLNRYTTLAAEEMHAAGRSAGLPSAVVRAKVAFWRMWLFKGGILDGWAGHGALPGLGILCSEQVHQALADGAPLKVLVTRTDRLGDLVLSLPVFADIKIRRPDWTVHAMVAPGSVPLVENDPHIDAVWTWTGSETGTELDELEGRLRRENFDAVVILQYQKNLAGLMKRAGIPKRYGPLSKGSSWFLLNRGSWQSRSRGRRHEMEHNLFLGRRLTTGWWATLGKQDASFPEPRLHLTEGQKAIGQEFRRDQAPGCRNPGFCTSRFRRVGSGLGTDTLRRGCQHPGRAPRVAGVHHRIRGDGKTVARVAGDLDPGVEVLLDRFSLREFMGVLSVGDLFIGPSTGPLHMAAALGCATVGLFPSGGDHEPGSLGTARSSEPGPRSRRWPVPARRICLETKCLLYNCMTRIFDDDVIEAALEVVHRKVEE